MAPPDCGLLESFRSRQFLDCLFFSGRAKNQLPVGLGVIAQAVGRLRGAYLNNWTVSVFPLLLVANKRAVDLPPSCAW